MPPFPSAPLFQRVAVIGIGLIGASMALAMREKNLAQEIVCADANSQHVKMALELDLVDHATTDATQAVAQADCVVLATPVGAFASILTTIGPFLKRGCIVTDVGSVKQDVVTTLSPLIPEGIAFIPGHPIAGTEFSGPDAGFADLFNGKWCLLTPTPDQPIEAINKIRRLWEGMGARVDVMSPQEHDRTLATTSHVPHILAFSLIGMADALSRDMNRDVMTYSAGTFRDMTRVAASDPIMWRDIFLTNQDAVLEISERLLNEIDKLRTLIKNKDAAGLEFTFSRARALKKNLTEQQQRQAGIHHLNEKKK